MSEYLEFLRRKVAIANPRTALPTEGISDVLFGFQQKVVERLRSTNGGAMFLDTGLGKTACQCEWAKPIDGDVLFVAPLAVANQTIREAEKLLGMSIDYSKDGKVRGQYTITNYERLDNFDHSRFKGVVLDESSILKGQTSKTKAFLCHAFRDTPYKLAATATPAPNDYTELGNHAEFLGIMNQQEMLTRWFVHDSANTADWRLKGHAVKPFWQWVASWAACVTKPSDLGFPDDGYDLPALTINTHIVSSELSANYDEGTLFDVGEANATNINRKMRETLQKRVDLVAEMVASTSEPVIVWCESNEESALLSAAIPDAVEVKGADHPDKKEERLMAFTDGQARVIISKPSICGHGMNWQHCRRQIFCSTKYSYEYFYQAVRRSYRFGQTQPVQVDVLIPDNAWNAWQAIRDKSLAHEKMKEHMKYACFANAEVSQVKVNYNPQKKGTLPSWLCK